MHEVVVRNRLEQLRKRQRDEALQAQVELLGTAAQPNTKQWPTEVQVPQSEAMEVDQEDIEVEPYSRDMSPPVVETARLPYEERQFPVVDPKAELQALVSSKTTFTRLAFLFVSRLRNGVLLRLLDSLLSPPNRRSQKPPLRPLLLRMRSPQK